MGFYASSKRTQVEKNHLISRNRKFYKLLTTTNAGFWYKTSFILSRWGKSGFFSLLFAIPAQEIFKSFHMDFHFYPRKWYVRRHHPPWFSPDSAVNDDAGARRCFHWHRRPDVFQLLEPLIWPRPPSSSPQRLLRSSPLQSGCGLIWLSGRRKKMLINILNSQTEAQPSQPDAALLSWTGWQYNQKFRLAFFYNSKPEENL